MEYRKRSFPFENSVPGSGLLVYRIDTAADGQGNRCGPPDEVYVYRPGGTPTSDGNLKQAFFASDAVPPRTAINDTTDPSSALSDWFPGGLSIHGIGAAGSTIGFTVDSVAACTKPGAFALTLPANGGNVAAAGTVTLTWGAASGATSYDVYFGTDSNPPLAGNQSGTSLTVNVTDNTTYFWRVAAKNACAQVFAPASGTWAFSAGASSGGITIFSDDFEGDLSKWKLGNTAGAAATAWGVVSCKTKDGNGAAWCAGGGSAAQPACTQYAPGEGTFLISGPFDLTDAVEGTWDFDLWTDIDDGGNPSDPSDVVYWMWSLDGRSYYGYGTAGATAGWEHVTVRMSDMTMNDGTPVTGKPKVYFAFLFLSDAATQKEGAYIDNVVIKKMLQAQATYNRWLPAVIHKDVPSRNAWWRSDVAVVNRSSQAANVTLTIHAPSGTKTSTLQLGGNAQALLKDVAGQMGIAADSGPLEVTSDQDVFLTGRTYSQVDATHTYGQDYDGAEPSSLLAAGQSAWLPQLTQNALFRTNVGITNTGNTAANVTVTLYDAAGNPTGWTQTKDYGAAEFYQYDQPFQGGGGIDSGYAKVTVNSGSGVVAYASVIDQATGDPTTINMKAGATIGAAPFAHWLPAVIHKDVPSRNAWWRSDVAVVNRSSQTANVTLTIHAPSGTQTQTITVAGQAQALLRDVAGQMGIAADSGPLEVTSDQDVFLTGRTYSQVDATHTYGQDYDGAEPSSLLAAGQSAWLPQLTQNALFRTNVGITNTGSATANVTVTLYDAAGGQVWSKTQDWAPGTFYQYDQPYTLTSAGSIDSGYAKVTVNSGSGVVAYASVIDQATGDPTTINMKR